MFGKILYISDNIAQVQNISGGNVNADLMNLHVIFESGSQRVLGEIMELNPDVIKIRFLGEYIDSIAIVAIVAVVLYNSFQSIVKRYEDDFQLLKLLFLSFSSADSKSRVNL